MQIKKIFNYPGLIFIFFVLITSSMNLGQKVFAYTGSDECSGNEECSPEEFCRKEDGDCDGVGVCSDRPEACIQLWTPVCGCDGETYSNSCMAALHGINVDYSGECNECTENDECAEGEFCKKEDKDCDGLGVCSNRPETCPQIWAPICGCDGLIYPNSCLAKLNGTNVASWRKCILFGRYRDNRFRKWNSRRTRRQLIFSSSPSL